MDRSPGHQGQGGKITCGARVRLDGIEPGRMVRAGFHRDPVAGRRAHGPELRHLGGRHSHEGHPDASDGRRDDGRAGKRRDHEKRGEHLAAFAGVDRCLAAPQARWPDFDREESLGPDAPDIGAEQPEGVDQSLHGPLPHLRHPVYPEGPLLRRGAQSGEESRRGAGQAREKIRFRSGDRATASSDPNLAGRTVLRHVEAKPAECLSHDPRVVAQESPGQGHGTVAQRGKKHRPVCKALRARDGRRCAGRPRERPNRKDVGKGRGHGAGRNLSR